MAPPPPPPVYSPSLNQARLHSSTGKSSPHRHGVYSTRTPYSSPIERRKPQSTVPVPAKEPSQAVDRPLPELPTDDALESSSVSLVARLKSVFHDFNLYKRLLNCRGLEAQKLLDSFQWLLDSPDLDTGFRRSLIVATQRLSRNSGIYPICFQLQHVVQEGEHPVSAGGFADIYKGHFEGQVVCLKAIRVYQNTQVKHVLKQFSKEVILWGQLSHPNVLPIYGLYGFQNRLCLVAPWMNHGDISNYLKEHPEACRPLLAADVAEGLQYLHSIGIIHGDVKGPNILINKAGRACVSDFGISSVSDTEILAWTSHSSASSKGGSIRWQAPELFDMENDEIVQNSMSTDVYAWGGVCYEAFTGHVPFINIPRETTIMLQVKAGARPFRPPDSSPPWQEWGLTENIWNLMQDCWNGISSERPAINTVLQRLMSELPSDYRPSASGSVLSPACFRQQMSKPIDHVTVPWIDAILANSALDSESEAERDDSTIGVVQTESDTLLQPSMAFGSDPDASYPTSIRLVRGPDSDTHHRRHRSASYDTRCSRSPPPSIIIPASIPTNILTYSSLKASSSRSRSSSPRRGRSRSRSSSPKRGRSRSRSSSPRRRRSLSRSSSPRRSRSRSPSRLYHAESQSASPYPTYPPPLQFPWATRKVTVIPASIAITVVSADLSAKIIMRNLFLQPQLFAAIYVDGLEKHTTLTAPDASDPRWYESITIPAKTTSKLTVKVYDRRKVKKDDPSCGLLGEGTVQIGDVLDFEEGQFKRYTLKLQRPGVGFFAALGSVNMHFSIPTQPSRSSRLLMKTSSDRRRWCYGWVNNQD